MLPALNSLKYQAGLNIRSSAEITPVSLFFNLETATKFNPLRPMDPSVVVYANVDETNQALQLIMNKKDTPSAGASSVSKVLPKIRFEKGDSGTLLYSKMLPFPLLTASTMNQDPIFSINQVQKTKAPVASEPTTAVPPTDAAAQPKPVAPMESGPIKAVPAEYNNANEPLQPHTDQPTAQISNSNFQSNNDDICY